MLDRQQLEKIIHDYVENYSIEANHSQRTIRNKRDCYKRFLKWLNDRAFSLQIVCEYLLFLRNKGLNPNSILDEVRMFRALTNFLFNRGYIKDNFALSIPKPKVPEKPFPYISPETALKVIDAGIAIGKGDRSRSKFYKTETNLALNFIIRTGLRISEVIALKGTDLNLDDDPPTFYVHSKGGDIDLLPLPRDMIDILRERVTNKRLFIITAKLCNEVLRRGTEKLGIKKITCHGLRHIFATNLAKNKVPPQFTTKLMRHESIEVTNKYYTHLDITDLSQIINSSQTVVREGLKQSEIYDMIISAVKSTGIDKDNRYSLTIETSSNALHIVLKNEDIDR